jgi:transposase-like protein
MATKPAPAAANTVPAIQAETVLRESPGALRNDPLLDCFVSQDELCRQLGICSKTLERWRRKSRGPLRTFLPGRKAAYSASSVRAWLASLEETPPEPPRSPGRPPTRRR